MLNRNRTDAPSRGKFRFGLQILIILSAAVLVVIDQFTKGMAVEHLKDKLPIELIPGIFELQYSENPGAALGMLEDHPWIFISVTIVVLLVLFTILMWGKYRQHKLVNISGTLIIAGGLGNLIDRLLHGYVVDFLYVKAINFPIFNFADCCVVIGAVLLLIFFFFIYREDTAETITQIQEDEQNSGSTDADSSQGDGGREA